MAVSGILQHLLISIHALREEGDERASRPRCGCPNFYPRPPRGGRLSAAGTEGLTVAFLSTPSARRATAAGTAAASSADISIHALREEGDKRPGSRPGPVGDFYPRPPRGGRHLRPLECSWVPPISIHALREEGDLR